MAKNTSRRNFLRTAPVAAAVGFSLSPLTEKLMLAAAPQAPAPAGAAPGADVAAAAVPLKYFKASQLNDDVKALQATPGNNNLVDQAPGIPCTVVMTTEVHKSGTDFEWHEGRDHVIQIIDGSTLYEVGGVPKNGRNTKPGEWLAPASEGSRSILMGKGDMLVLPRGTPHKRSTEDAVTLILISSYGTMKA